jgi:DNA-directed RNA polymerase specialized sigma24 family protein
MKNYCLQILQQENPEIVVDSDMDVEEPDEIVQLFEEEGTESDRKLLLKNKIKKLPVEQRIAIIRFFTEEMSYLDIADSTGYNLNQVKNHIRNGMHNLRNYMGNNDQNSQ